MAPLDPHARNGRIRIHPAILQLAGGLLIFAGSLVAGYYRGSSDQAQKTSDLGTRVSVLEERSAATSRTLEEIKADVKTLVGRSR